MSTREKLLSLLKAEKKDWVSGEQLREKLGISRAGVSKHIRVLRAKGYTILSSTKKGYFLSENSRQILAEEIRDGLTTQVFGKQEIICLTETDSTNLQADRLASGGAPEGTLVLSENQSAGRGRKGRLWFSSRDKGIFLSMIIRPAMSPMESSRMTLMTAVALAETLIRLTALPIRIKWPNDLLVGQRKLAGILTELSMEMDAVNYVIIGLGLNVNIPRGEFPRELKKTATSILGETGKTFSRNQITRLFLQRFETYYFMMNQGGFDEIIARWKALSDILGKEVSVDMIGKKISGTVADVDSSGSLILKDKAGTFHSILSGDVTFLYSMFEFFCA